MAKAKEKQLSTEDEAQLLVGYRIMARIALRRLQREKAEAADQQQTKRDSD